MYLKDINENKFKSETYLDEDDFYIIKLKDYDGNNKKEEKFLNGLFGNNKKYTKISSLKNSFYMTADSIMKMCEKDKKGLLYDNKKQKNIIYILSIVILSLMLFYPIYSVYNYYNILFVSLFLFVIIIACIKIFFDNKNILYFLINTIIFLFVSFIIIKSIGSTIIYYKKIYLLLYIFGTISIIITIIFGRRFYKRNKEANELYGRILGFKNFLITVEKEKLNSLVLENPNYFYDILPYTYVLDISDKWIKNFENIVVKTPNWYYDENAIDIYILSKKIDTIIMSKSNDICHSSRVSNFSNSFGSSSIGGSSSGGGFSGGGSGGGGGGSW